MTLMYVYKIFRLSNIKKALDRISNMPSMSRRFLAGNAAEAICGGDWIVIVGRLSYTYVHLYMHARIHTFIHHVHILMLSELITSIFVCKLVCIYGRSIRRSTSI